MKIFTWFQSWRPSSDVVSTPCLRETRAGLICQVPEAPLRRNLDEAKHLFTTTAFDFRSLGGFLQERKNTRLAFVPVGLLMAEILGTFSPKQHLLFWPKSGYGLVLFAIAWDNSKRRMPTGHGQFLYLLHWNNVSCGALHVNPTLYHILTS